MSEPGLTQSKTNTHSYTHILTYTNKQRNKQIVHCSAVWCSKKVTYDGVRNWTPARLQSALHNNDEGPILNLELQHFYARMYM